MISCVVLTRNEEKNIKRCLNSLKWCKEIILIDDFSIDNTLKIGKRLGAKVYKRYLDNDFAAQRNYGLQKAKGEWILFVDADETVSKSLREEVLLKIQDTEYNGFCVKRRDLWMGKDLRYGESGNIKLLRLAKKGSGKWRRSVHEEWMVRGEIGQLENPLLHYPHTTIKDFVRDINIYSSLHAKENLKSKKRFNFLFVIFHPTGKFFVNYFLKLGFLDGTTGFVQAVFMSFHSFLSWSKVWIS